MEKAFRASFWKKISLRKYKAKRLSDVLYIYNFMKRVRGHRDVPKKVLSAEEQAAHERQAAVSTQAQPSFQDPCTPSRCSGVSFEEEEVVVVAVVVVVCDVMCA